MALRKVQSAVIADNAITTDKIAAGAVTASDLAAGAVTPPTPTVVSDQDNTSTGYFDVPVGTTAQRPVSPNAGYIRYNSDLGNLEQYTASGWGSIAPPPTISSVSPSSYNGNAGTSFTINGLSFGGDVNVRFITNSGTEYNASSVTRVSANQLIATTPQDFTVADEPLDVKVIQGSGSAIIENAIDCGGVPNWITPSGSLGTVNEKKAVSITLSATDPEDGAVQYAVENGSSLPSGITLNSSTGVLSGTSPAISNDTTYNFTIGATDVATNKTTRSFSLTNYAGDDYWGNTIALFKGTGSGGQKTFIDSSTTNASVTVTGDAHQNKFSPYNAGWSGYFDNQSSQYLSITDASNNFDFGSGDFTIESWCFANSYKNSFARPWGFAVEGTPTGSGIGLFYTTDKNGQVIYIRSQTAGDTSVTINSPTGRWFHLALVRDGGTIRLYQNGIQVGTQSVSGAMFYNNRFRIGASNSNSPTEFWDGYISNVRIVKGTCLYPSGTTFTPSTSKLTAVSGTVLLTCQDNRYIDRSSANHTISAVNYPPTVCITPFGQEVNETNGSVYFDGSGDRLEVPSSSVSAITNNQFTIECWLYPETFTTESLFRRIWSIGTSLTNDLTCHINTNGNVVIRINDGIVIDNGVLQANAWNHVVVSRNSSNLLKLHINGVLVGSTTNSTNFSSQTANPLHIGNEAGRTDGTLKGFISDFRVVPNTDVYGSGSFTPPTQPLSAISNTSLLLKFNNSKFVDLVGNFSLKPSGDVTATTSVVKYGSASSQYDGNGDHYTISQAIPYNSTNWLNTETITRVGTIEAWVYLTAVQSSPLEAYLFRSIISRGDTYLNWGVAADQRMCWYWYNASTNQNFSYSSGTVSLNTWVHLAVTFNSGNVYHWINGVASGSSSFNGIAFAVGDRSASGGDTTNIGQVFNRPSSSWNGYIDEVRITPGIVRYSANFTPPSRFMSNFSG